MYIKKKSNHLPTLFKKLAKAIARRVPEISSIENVFNKSISIHTKALAKSGFNESNKDTPKSAHNNIPEEKKQKQKITWFKPHVV